jgi:hypothetical protein
MPIINALRKWSNHLVPKQPVEKARVLDPTNQFLFPKTSLRKIFGLRQSLTATCNKNLQASYHLTCTVVALLPHAAEYFFFSHWLAPDVLFS